MKTVAKTVTLTAKQLLFLTRAQICTIFLLLFLPGYLSSKNWFLVRDLRRSRLESAKLQEDIAAYQELYATQKKDVSSTPQAPQVAPALEGAGEGAGAVNPVAASGKE